MFIRTLSSLIVVTLLALPACRSKSKILATVNGHDVTQAEFDAYLRLKHVPVADEKRRQRALDEYVERLALTSVIEKEPLFDKVTVDAEIAEARKETEINRYFERYLDGKVNDAAIKNYYDAHAAEYEERKVHVAHILIRTNPKMTEEERNAKQATARDLYNKLQGKETFEDLARASSEDRVSAAKGGDLGWQREGSIDPEFSKRAFAAKAGTVSEPFQTQFGFHLLKVLDEPQLIRKPYSAVLGDIRSQLRAEAKAAELKRLGAKFAISAKHAYESNPAAVASERAVGKAPPASPEFQRDPSPRGATNPASLGLPARAPAPSAAALSRPSAVPHVTAPAKP